MLPKHLVNKIMTYYIWFCQQDRPDDYLKEVQEQSVKTLNKYLLTTINDKNWMIVLTRASWKAWKDECLGCNGSIEQCPTRQKHPYDCMGPPGRVMLVSKNKCYRCNKPREQCDHFKAHQCDHDGFSDTNHQLTKYTFTKTTWEQRVFDAVPPNTFKNKFLPFVFSHDGKNWAKSRQFVLLVSNDTCYGCKLPRQQCSRFLACNVDHFGFTQPQQFKKGYTKLGWLNSYLLPALPKVVFPKENICNVVKCSPREDWNYEDSQQDNYEPLYSYHYHVGDYSFYCARPDGKCYCGRDRKDCHNFQHYNKDCQGFSSIYEHNAC